MSNDLLWRELNTSWRVYVLSARDERVAVLFEYEEAKEVAESVGVSFQIIGSGLEINFSAKDWTHAQTVAQQIYIRLQGITTC